MKYKVGDIITFERRKPRDFVSVLTNKKIKIYPRDYTFIRNELIVIIEAIHHKTLHDCLKSNKDNAYICYYLTGRKTGFDIVVFEDEVEYAKKK